VGISVEIAKEPRVETVAVTKVEIAEATKTLVQATRETGETRVTEATEVIRETTRETVMATRAVN
jgi:hypothetical protein